MIVIQHHFIMNVNNLFSLSIDIGGTKIHVSTYDSHGSVGISKRYATKEFFHHHKVSDFTDLLSQITIDFPFETYENVGLAMNCAVKNNTIVYSSLLGGKVNVDLNSMFKKFFNFEHFAADNDVICMAKSEIIYGIGKKVADFVYINLGTGIRLAAVENKHILRGNNGLAGEISLLPLWVPELGQYVEVDTLISGKGLAFLSEKISQKSQTAEEIFASQDQKVISVFVNQFSEFLRLCTYMFNPSTFVVGGSLTKSASQWLPEVTKQYLQGTHELFASQDIFISSIEDSASKGALITLE